MEMARKMEIGRKMEMNRKMEMGSIVRWKSRGGETVIAERNGRER
jgi:hypothetical protein